MRRGATLVEFAMVAPFLFFLVFLFVEFDRYILTVHALEEASRVGCRLAILEQSTRQEVEENVAGILGKFGINKYTMTITPGLPNSLEAGSPVSVKISAAYKDVSWLPTPRFLSNKSLSATSTMPREK
jgi:Flp pilus assembly protein TadG